MLKNSIISVIVCLTIGAAVSFVLSACGMAGQDSSKGTVTTVASQSGSKTADQKETFVEKRDSFSYHGEELHYLLILPGGYSLTADKWPMILFLHGGSGRGRNLDMVKSYGPPWLAEEQSDFPFVVLAPQCPEQEYWTTKADLLAALLDDISQKYRIDRQRVYLTGTSMGGNGTWELASRHPEYFAAAAPMAANPTLPGVWPERLVTLPIWAFHGDQDDVCPLKSDEAMIEALRARGATPRFTVLSGEGHYIGGVYKNRELYDWFLAHTRRP
ncbi:MAG: prolyl oligopeptidase family serine peptidase [Negativicutes bacterium]|nr:prolyl oligopeptidase family serine peptidase [Negativicutes bacterium]